MKRRVALLFIFGLLSLLAGLSQRSYHYPNSADLRKKAHYLERIIRTPLGPASELTALGQQNPEWALFSLSFSVYAFTNLAQLDASFQPEAAHYTQLAIQKALSDSIAGAFRPAATESVTNSNGSVLYLGHLNLMLGCLRLLSPASPYAGLHDSLSRALYERFAWAPTYCLESYPGMIWVPDNTVALASLQLHSDVTGSTYGSICRHCVLLPKNWTV